jgi:hypothetical protein
MDEGRWARDEGRGMKDDGRGMMDEKKTKKIRTVRDLKVYRKALDSAMEIFELTKKFPKEETYSLTDQIRRASRSVCSNLSEAIFLRPSVFRSVVHLHSEAVFLLPSVFHKPPTAAVPTI